MTLGFEGLELFDFRGGGAPSVATTNIPLNWKLEFPLASLNF